MHCASLFNDNLDGTLSQVGIHRAPQPGVNGFPALIISRNPLDPNEPPMPDPSRPALHRKVLPAAKHKKIVQKPPVLKQQPALYESWQPVSANAKKLWHYMLPHLPKNVSCISFNPTILGLLELPRQRDAKWRSRYKGVVKDNPNQIMALIIYLTGQDVFAGSQKCKQCTRHHGPFPHCVALKKGLSVGSESAVITSCANCVYNPNQTDLCNCTGSNTGATTARPPADSVGHKRPRVADSEVEQPMAIRRRFDRSDMDEDDDSGHRRNLVKANPRGDSRPAPGSSSLVQMPAERAVNGRSPFKNEAFPPSALIHAGQLQPDDLLEMEDWEMAPGRIRATGPGAPHGKCSALFPCCSHGQCFSCLTRPWLGRHRVFQVVSRDQSGYSNITRRDFRSEGNQGRQQPRARGR